MKQHVIHYVDDEYKSSNAASQGEVQGELYQQLARSSDQACTNDASIINCTDYFEYNIVRYEKVSSTMLT